MRLFSRPLASRTRASRTRWSTYWANRFADPAPVQTHRGVRAPHGRSGAAWRFISGQETQVPHVRAGLEVLGVLELTALASIGEERWVLVRRQTCCW